MGGPNAIRSYEMSTPFTGKQMPAQRVLAETVAKAINDSKILDKLITWQDVFRALEDTNKNKKLEINVAKLLEIIEKKTGIVPIGIERLLNKLGAQEIKSQLATEQKPDLVDGKNIPLEPSKPSGSDVFVEIKDKLAKLKNEYCQTPSAFLEDTPDPVKNRSFQVARATLRIRLESAIRKALKTNEKELKVIQKQFPLLTEDEIVKFILLNNGFNQYGKDLGNYNLLVNILNGKGKTFFEGFGVDLDKTLNSDIEYLSASTELTSLVVGSASFQEFLSSDPKLEIAYKNSGLATSLSVNKKIKTVPPALISTYQKQKKEIQTQVQRETWANNAIEYRARKNKAIIENDFSYNWGKQQEDYAKININFNLPIELLLWGDSQMVAAGLVKQAKNNPKAQPVSAEAIESSILSLRLNAVKTVMLKAEEKALDEHINKLENEAIEKLFLADPKLKGLTRSDVENASFKQSFLTLVESMPKQKVTVDQLPPEGDKSKIADLTGVNVFLGEHYNDDATFQKNKAEFISSVQALIDDGVDTIKITLDSNNAKQITIEGVGEVTIQKSPPAGKDPTKEIYGKKTDPNIQAQFVWTGWLDPTQEEINIDVDGSLRGNLVSGPEFQVSPITEFSFGRYNPQTKNALSRFQHYYESSSAEDLADARITIDSDFSQNVLNLNNDYAKSTAKQLAEVKPFQDSIDPEKKHLLMVATLSATGGERQSKALDILIATPGLIDNNNAEAKQQLLEVARLLTQIKQPAFAQAYLEVIPEKLINDDGTIDKTFSEALGKFQMNKTQEKTKESDFADQGRIVWQNSQAENNLPQNEALYLKDLKGLSPYDVSKLADWYDKKTDRYTVKPDLTLPQLDSRNQFLTYLANKQQNSTEVKKINSVLDAHKKNNFLSDGDLKAWEARLKVATSKKVAFDSMPNTMQMGLVIINEELINSLRTDASRNTTLNTTTLGDFIMNSRIGDDLIRRGLSDPYPRMFNYLTSQCKNPAERNVVTAVRGAILNKENLAKQQVEDFVRLVKRVEIDSYSNGGYSGLEQDVLPLDVGTTPKAYVDSVVNVEANSLINLSPDIGQPLNLAPTDGSKPESVTVGNLFQSARYYPLAPLSLFLSHLRNPTQPMSEMLSTNNSINRADISTIIDDLKQTYKSDEVSVANQLYFHGILMPDQLVTIRVALELSGSDNIPLPAYMSAEQQSAIRDLITWFKDPTSGAERRKLFGKILSTQNSYSIVAPERKYEVEITIDERAMLDQFLKATASNPLLKEMGQILIATTFRQLANNTETRIKQLEAVLTYMQDKKIDSLSPDDLRQNKGLPGMELISQYASFARYELASFDYSRVGAKNTNWMSSLTNSSAIRMSSAGASRHPMVFAPDTTKLILLYVQYYLAKGETAKAGLLQSMIKEYDDLTKLKKQKIAERDVAPVKKQLGQEIWEIEKKLSIINNNLNQLKQGMAKVDPDFYKWFYNAYVKNTNVNLHAGQDYLSQSLFEISATFEDFGGRKVPFSEMINLLDAARKDESFMQEGWSSLLVTADTPEQARTKMAFAQYVNMMDFSEGLPEAGDPLTNVLWKNINAAFFGGTEDQVTSFQQAIKFQQFLDTATLYPSDAMNYLKFLQENKVPNNQFDLASLQVLYRVHTDVVTKTGQIPKNEEDALKHAKYLAIFQQLIENHAKKAGLSDNIKFKNGRLETLYFGESATQESVLFDLGRVSEKVDMDKLKPDDLDKLTAKEEMYVLLCLRDFFNFVRSGSSVDPKTFSGGLAIRTGDPRTPGSDLSVKGEGAGGRVKNWLGDVLFPPLKEEFQFKLPTAETSDDGVGWQIGKAVFQVPKQYFSSMLLMNGWFPNQIRIGMPLKSVVLPSFENFKDFVGDKIPISNITGNADVYMGPDEKGVPKIENVSAQGLQEVGLTFASIFRLKHDPFYLLQIFGFWDDLQEGTYTSLFHAWLMLNMLGMMNPDNGEKFRDTFAGRAVSFASFDWVFKLAESTGALQKLPVEGQNKITKSLDKLREILRDPVANGEKYGVWGYMLKEWDASIKRLNETDPVKAKKEAKFRDYFVKGTQVAINSWPAEAINKGGLNFYKTIFNYVAKNAQGDDPRLGFVAVNKSLEKFNKVASYANLARSGGALLAKAAVAARYSDYWSNDAAKALAGHSKVQDFNYNPYQSMIGYDHTGNWIDYRGGNPPPDLQQVGLWNGLSGKEAQFFGGRPLTLLVKDKNNNNTLAPHDFRVRSVSVDSPELAGNSVAFTLHTPSNSSNLNEMEVDVHIASHVLQRGSEAIQSAIIDAAKTAKEFDLALPVTMTNSELDALKKEIKASLSNHGLNDEKTNTDFNSFAEYLKLHPKKIREFAAFLKTFPADQVFKSFNEVELLFLQKLSAVDPLKKMVEHRRLWDMVHRLVPSNEKALEAWQTALEKGEVATAETEWTKSQKLVEGTHYTQEASGNITLLEAGKQKIAQSLTRENLSSQELNYIETNTALYLKAQLTAKKAFEKYYHDGYKSLVTKSQLTNKFENLKDGSPSAERDVGLMAVWMRSLNAASKQKNMDIVPKFVQVIGGYAATWAVDRETRIGIDQGAGEGKTFTLTLPTFFDIAAGRRAIIATSNDADARAGIEETRGAYEMIGVKTATFVKGDDDLNRKNLAGEAKIIYGALSNFNFQDLFDFHRTDGGMPILPADWSTMIKIYIDEADLAKGDLGANPARISGSGKLAKDAKEVMTADSVVREWFDEKNNFKLKPGFENLFNYGNDYANVYQLTEEGRSKVIAKLKGTDWESKPQELFRHIEAALLAYHGNRNGEEYVFFDKIKGEVVTRKEVFSAGLKGALASLINGRYEVILINDGTKRYMRGQQPHAELLKALMFKEFQAEKVITSEITATLEVTTNQTLNKLITSVMLSGTQSEKFSENASDGIMSFSVEANQLATLQVANRILTPNLEQQLDLVVQNAVRQFLDGNPVLVHAAREGVPEGSADSTPSRQLTAHDIQRAITAKIAEIKADLNHPDNAKLEAIEKTNAALNVIRVKKYTNELSTAEDDLNKAKVDQTISDAQREMKVKQLEHEIADLKAVVKRAQNNNMSVQVITGKDGIDNTEKRKEIVAGWIGSITVTTVTNRARDVSRELLISLFKELAKVEDVEKAIEYFKSELNVVITKDSLKTGQLQDVGKTLKLQDVGKTLKETDDRLRLEMGLSKDGIVGVLTEVEIARTLEQIYKRQARTNKTLGERDPGKVIEIFSVESPFWDKVDPAIKAYVAKQFTKDNPVLVMQAGQNPEIEKLEREIEVLIEKNPNDSAITKKQITVLRESEFKHLQANGVQGIEKYKSLYVKYGLLDEKDIDTKVEESKKTEYREFANKLVPPGLRNIIQNARENYEADYESGLANQAKYREMSNKAGEKLMGVSQMLNGQNSIDHYSKEGVPKDKDNHTVFRGVVGVVHGATYTVLDELLQSAGIDRGFSQLSEAERAERIKQFVKMVNPSSGIKEQIDKRLNPLRNTPYNIPLDETALIKLSKTNPALVYESVLASVDGFFEVDGKPLTDEMLTQKAGVAGHKLCDEKDFKLAKETIQKILQEETVKLAQLIQERELSDKFIKRNGADNYQAVLADRVQRRLARELLKGERGFFDGMGIERTIKDGNIDVRFRLGDIGWSRSMFDLLGLNRIKDGTKPRLIGVTGKPDQNKEIGAKLRYITETGQNRTDTSANPPEWSRATIKDANNAEHTYNLRDPKQQKDLNRGLRIGQAEWAPMLYSHNEDNKLFQIFGDSKTKNESVALKLSAGSTIDIPLRIMEFKSELNANGNYDTQGFIVHPKTSAHDISPDGNDERYEVVIRYVALAKTIKDIEKKADPKFVAESNSRQKDAAEIMSLTKTLSSGEVKEEIALEVYRDADGRERTREIKYNPVLMAAQVENVKAHEIGHAVVQEGSLPPKYEYNKYTDGLLNTFNEARADFADNGRLDAIMRHYQAGAALNNDDGLKMKNEAKLRLHLYLFTNSEGRSPIESTATVSDIVMPVIEKAKAAAEKLAKAGDGKDDFDRLLEQGGTLSQVRSKTRDYLEQKVIELEAACYKAEEKIKSELDRTPEVKEKSLLALQKEHLTKIAILLETRDVSDRVRSDVADISVHAPMKKELDENRELLVKTREAVEQVKNQKMAEALIGNGPLTSSDTAGLVTATSSNAPNIGSQFSYDLLLGTAGGRTSILARLTEMAEKAELEKLFQNETDLLKSFTDGKVAEQKLRDGIISLRGRQGQIAFGDEWKNSFDEKHKAEQTLANQKENGASLSIQQSTLEQIDRLDRELASLTTSKGQMSYGEGAILAREGILYGKAWQNNLYGIGYDRVAPAAAKFGGGTLSGAVQSALSLAYDGITGKPTPGPGESLSQILQGALGFGVFDLAQYLVGLGSSNPRNKWLSYKGLAVAEFGSIGREVRLVDEHRRMSVALSIRKDMYSAKHFRQMKDQPKILSTPISEDLDTYIARNKADIQQALTQLPANNQPSDKAIVEMLTANYPMQKIIMAELDGATLSQAEINIALFKLTIAGGTLDPRFNANMIADNWFNDQVTAKARAKFPVTDELFLEKTFGVEKVSLKGKSALEYVKEKSGKEYTQTHLDAGKIGLSLQLFYEANVPLSDDQLKEAYKANPRWAAEANKMLVDQGKGGSAEEARVFLGDTTGLGVFVAATHLTGVGMSKVPVLKGWSKFATSAASMFVGGLVLNGVSGWANESKLWLKVAPYVDDLNLQEAADLFGKVTAHLPSAMVIDAIDKHGWLKAGLGAQWGETSTRALSQLGAVGDYYLIGYGLKKSSNFVLSQLLRTAGKQGVKKVATVTAASLLTGPAALVATVGSIGWAAYDIWDVYDSYDRNQALSKEDKRNLIKHNADREAIALAALGWQTSTRRTVSDDLLQQLILNTHFQRSSDGKYLFATEHDVQLVQNYNDAMKEYAEQYGVYREEKYTYDHSMFKGLRSEPKPPLKPDYPSFILSAREKDEIANLREVAAFRPDAQTIARLRATPANQPERLAAVLDSDFSGWRSQIATAFLAAQDKVGNNELLVRKALMADTVAMSIFTEEQKAAIVNLAFLDNKIHQEIAKAKTDVLLMDLKAHNTFSEAIQQQLLDHFSSNILSTAKEAYQALTGLV